MYAKRSFPTARFLALGVVAVTLAFAAPAWLPGRADAKSSGWCVSPNPAVDCTAYPSSQWKTTLTAAIAAASPGQFIYIYPATYTDHPNVNKASLNIIGVNGPATTIFNGGGTTPITVSAGNVVIDGLTATNGDGGIDAGSTPINGNFTLKNFHADNNTDAIAACNVSHTCYGVWVIASGNILLQNGTANGNGSSVSCSGNAPDPEHSPGFDGETCFGILATSTGGNADLKNVTANNNGAPGTCSLHETCFGIMLDEVKINATVNTATATGNGSTAGNCAEAGATHQGDFCFGIGADGVSGNVAMTGITASNNGAFGSCLTTGDHGSDACYGILADGDDNSAGGFTLTNATANTNGAHGSATSSCNGNDTCNGVIIDGLGGNAILNGVTANGNGAQLDCSNSPGRDSCGGILSDPSDVTGVFNLTNIKADNNGAGRDCTAGDSCFGIQHDESDHSLDVTLNTVETNSNGAGRDCPGRDSCQGVLVDVGDNAGNFSLSHMTANDNGAGRDCTGTDTCLGILVDGGTFGPGNAYLTDITTNHNTAGRDCKSGSNQCFGLSVDGVVGNIDMNQITANNNKAGGLCSSTQSCFGALAESDGRGNVQLKTVTASGNGATTGACPTVGDPSCFGVHVENTTDIPEKPPGAGNADLRFVTASNNTLDGIIVDAFGNISLKCLTTTGNGGMNLRTNKPATVSC
jgi:hypothetical protein